MRFFFSSRHIHSILNPRHFMIIYLNMKKLFHRGLNEIMIVIYLKFLLFFFNSYPYSEQHHEARSYLRARCPAWCDRILLSHSFKHVVNSEVKFLLKSSYLHSQSRRSIDQPTISLVTMFVLVIIRYFFNVYL